MTVATQIIPTQPRSPSSGFTLSPEASALSVELAKCLKLVAPASMAADAQLSWIASAIDSLEGIRAAEVAAVSAEIRRSVTRPAQIVPEIAKLVSERRRKTSQATATPTNCLNAKERAINAEAMAMRVKAATRHAVEVAWRWERGARIEAGLPVRPVAPPLSRDELAGLPPHLIELGMSGGHIARGGGELVEVPLSVDKVLSDSGSDRNGENARSAVEGEASQSGGGTAGASPEHRTPQ